MKRGREEKDDSEIAFKRPTFLDADGESIVDELMENPEGVSLITDTSDTKYDILSMLAAIDKKLPEYSDKRKDLLEKLSKKVERDANKHMWAKMPRASRELQAKCIRAYKNKVMKNIKHKIDQATAKIFNKICGESMEIISLLGEYTMEDYDFELKEFKPKKPLEGPIGSPSSFSGPSGPSGPSGLDFDPCKPDLVGITDTIEYDIIKNVRRMAEIHSFKLASQVFHIEPCDVATFIGDLDYNPPMPTHITLNMFKSMPFTYEEYAEMIRKNTIPKKHKNLLRPFSRQHINNFILECEVGDFLVGMYRFPNLETVVDIYLDKSRKEIYFSINNKQSFPTCLMDCSEIVLGKITNPPHILPFTSEMCDKILKPTEHKIIYLGYAKYQAKWFTIKYLVDIDEIRKDPIWEGGIYNREGRLIGLK